MELMAKLTPPSFCNSFFSRVKVGKISFSSPIAKLLVTLTQRGFGSQKNP